MIILIARFCHFQALKKCWRQFSSWTVRQFEQLLNSDSDPQSLHESCFWMSEPCDPESACRGVGGRCIKEQASSLFPELISRWFWMFCQQHACLIWAHMHFLHEFSCMSLGQLVSVHFNVPVRATPPPHHRLSAGQQFYRWSDMSFYFCILQAASDVTQFPSSILGHDEIFELCKHVCVCGGGMWVCVGGRGCGVFNLLCCYSLQASSFKWKQHIDLFYLLHLYNSSSLVCEKWEALCLLLLLLFLTIVMACSSPEVLKQSLFFFLTASLSEDVAPPHSEKITTFCTKTEMMIIFKEIVKKSEWRYIFYPSTQK